jgi:ribose transport system substrate-binding protein
MEIFAMRLAHHAPASAVPGCVGREELESTAVEPAGVATATTAPLPGRLFFFLTATFGLGCLGLMLLALSVGCDSSPATSGRVGTGDGTLRIAVIPKGTSHQFWRSVHAGALAAAEEIGNVEILWKGPETEADTAGQIAVVKNFITRGVDAMVLAPNHSQALIDAVYEAVAESVPVVIFDSGLGSGPEIVSYVATDNFRGGQLAAARLADAMGESGQVILLRYKEGSESTEQRELGFLDAIAAYPNIRVLSSDQYGGTSTQEALAKSTQLLNRYRDQVTGIFAVCEPNANGVLEALRQTGLAGQVKFVAFDPSDSLIEGLLAGQVAGIVLQDPFQMGFQSVQAAVARLNGEAVEPVIATGEFVATAENHQQAPWDRLLRPQMYGQ